jgi:hypothetical protein
LFPLILLFLHLLTYIYIVWATSYSFLLLEVVSPFQPPFCWRENIGDNKKKKDTMFLVVWDRDSYIERFLVLLPCTCVLQPKLVHLCQTSSLLPSHLPIVASQFKITLLAPLQWAHQTHSSFRFPSLSLFLLYVLPLVCDPCPIILLHLF